MFNEAKITYGMAIPSSNILYFLENKKQKIIHDWSTYISTTKTNTDEIITEKLQNLFGGISIGATTSLSNSRYSLVELTVGHDFLRISNHDCDDRNMKNQMKNTPDIFIHDFQFGGIDSYDYDVLQLNSPTHGLIECLRETICINSNHLLAQDDVVALLDAIIKMIKDEGHTFRFPFSTTENVHRKNMIVIKESKLRSIIRETLRRILLTA